MKTDPIAALSKYSQIGLILFFCASLLLGLAGSFVDRDSMPNFREQRRLAPRPTFDKILSLNGPSLLSKFAADNFGFRKPLLSTYFKFRLEMLHADLGLPALIGKDGWLFIADEIPGFRHQDLLTDAQAERIRNSLDAWCEYAHQHGAEFVFFAGPNKSTIYPEMMSVELTQFAKNPSLLDQVNMLDYRCNFIRVDLRDTLIKNRDELLYYKWGTHWNDRATQLAWNHIKEAVRTRAPNLRWPEVEQSNITYRPAKPLEDSMWQWFGFDDPYTVLLPRISINPSPARKSEDLHDDHTAKILVFGDSFLTFMRGNANIVANNFSSWRLEQGDKFSFRPEDTSKDAWLITGGGGQRKIELVEEFKPNLVMLEVVERNILSIADLPLPENSKHPASRVAQDKNTSFYVTDANWVQGIARNWTGFYVPNNPKSIKQYVAGRRLRFADGQERHIIRVQQKGEYLNVWVSGVPLDGKKVGYPDAITVLDSSAE